MLVVRLHTKHSCKNKFLVLDAVGLQPARSATARELWNQEVAFAQLLSWTLSIQLSIIQREKRVFSQPLLVKR